MALRESTSPTEDGFGHRQGNVMGLVSRAGPSRLWLRGSSWVLGDGEGLCLGLGRD